MAHVVFTTIASIDDLPNAHWQAGDNQSYANTMARIPARQDIRLIARQAKDKSIQLQYASNGRGDWQIVNGWHLVLAKFFTENLKQRIATLPEGAPLQPFIESIDEPKAAHAAQQLIALECGINVTKEPHGALHRAVQIVQASLCALGVPCADWTFTPLFDGFETMTPAAPKPASNAKTAATQAIVFYLHGLRDAGVALGHDDYVIPPELHEQVKCVMQAAADEDHFASTGLNEYERGGKWFRAANIAMCALDKESRAMTAGAEYRQGLPWGDKMHASLLYAMSSAMNGAA